MKNKSFFLIRLFLNENPTVELFNSNNCLIYVSIDSNYQINLQEIYLYKRKFNNHE